MNYCGRCGKPKEEHPFVGGKNNQYTRFCDIVLIAEKDGKTYEVDVFDDDYSDPRTKKNNKRWASSSRAMEAMI